jgi:hypothetical protein
MEIASSDSNTLGNFSLTYEMQTDTELVRALMSLCKVLHAEPHESGRGTRYVAASALFQPLLEGEEIPEYRIEFRQDSAPFDTMEDECRALAHSGLRFAAFRQHIIRVPTIRTEIRMH